MINREEKNGVWVIGIIRASTSTMCYQLWLKCRNVTYARTYLIDFHFTLMAIKRSIMFGKTLIFTATTTRMPFKMGKCQSFRHSFIHLHFRMPSFICVCQGTCSKCINEKKSSPSIFMYIYIYTHIYIV